MGIPISVVISPLVYGALLVGNDLVNLLIPTPDLFYLLANAKQDPTPQSGIDSTSPLGPILALVVPGMIVMAIAWLSTRTLFLRAGPEGIIRALGAREPQRDDLEEQQLSNVVAEMAIAAGVKPPRVMLLDGTAANAAAIGSSHDDATVVVSRRLLDELDRDETQAVVGHLIGAVGNGDLRVALALLSLFRTIGLIMTALGAALGPASRKTLLRLLKLAFRKPGAPVSEEEARQVDEMLSRSVEMEEGDIDQISAKGKTTILDMIKLPFLMAYTAIWMSRIAFMSFVIAPLMALVWRSRRYLADATAVQLTRNPDGLAKALASLSAKGGMIPGGSWAAPLFIIGPRGSGRSFGGPKGASGLMGDEFGVLAFDPAIARRIARLRQQGATVDLAVPPSRTHPLTLGCIVLLVVPLGVVLIGCALTLAGIALAIDMLFLMPMLLVCYFVLRRVLGG